MPLNIEKEMAAMQAMSVTELCERYAEVFGEDVRSHHRKYLIRKIAWRMQALAEGDLSERARRRAEQLANDADVRVMPPKAPLPCPPALGAPLGHRVATLPLAGDPRLPSPGTALVRNYKGRAFRVVVLPEGKGFDFEGQQYKTLTAVAETITGSHINGFRFFHLEGKK